MRIRELLLLCISSSLLFVLNSSAQVRKPLPSKAAAKPSETQSQQPEIKPQERPVSVLLKQGEPVNGTFVNSNAAGLRVRVADNDLVVKWDSIAQVVFTDVAQVAQSPKVDEKAEKQKAALKSVLKSLRKLVAATDILSWGKRADFEEFGKRYIDVKAEVGEVFSDIPDSEAKEELKKALEAYDDGLRAWKYIFGDNPLGRTSGDLFPDFEPGKTLQQKYSIPTYNSGSLHLMGGDKVLGTIWQAARAHIEAAEKSAKVD